MNIKKPLLVAGAVTTMSVTGLTGLGVASAATNTSASSNDGTSSLIDKLASKFNLNKHDVQAVFDEDRAAHEADHQQKIEEELSQAVTDGKITDVQKAKILAKMKELQSQREASREKFKDMTEADRRQAMKSEINSLRAWADENGISMEYLHVGGGMRMRGGAPGPGQDMSDNVPGITTNQN